MARYHVNRLGRLSSPDPLGGSISDPQSLNRYVYVRSEPIDLTDPLGLHDNLVCDDNGVCYPAAPDVTSVEVSSGSSLSDQTEENLNPNNGIGDDLDLYFMSIGGGPGSAEKIPINFARGTGNFENLRTVFACDPKGTAPPPSYYASRGANSGSLLDVQNFRRGGELDAQVRYGASPGYANYVYGVYMSATGYSLAFALFGANRYGKGNSQYSFTPENPADKNYAHIPATNVSWITNGYNDYQNGTLCTP